MGFQAADNNPASNLPASALTLLTQAVLKQCGDQYAIADGFLNDPLICHFKPEQIQCQPGQDPMTCLTTPQVQAAEKIYDGLIDPRTQKLIWPGLLRGSENPGGGAGWLGQSINGPNPSSVVDFFYGVYDNFSLNFHTLDPVAAALLADETFPYVDHIDTNLLPFIYGGGKLLIYHGEADQLISTRSTVDYYGSVVEKVRHQGGNPSSGKALSETEESVRLFLVPGMGHCTGGPGPYTFDAFEPLVSWVEQGKAPDKIIASHITSGITTFTRPLCPYPQEAEWTGAGERTDASNWVCVKGPADFDDRFYDYWDAKFGISNRGSDHD